MIRKTLLIIGLAFLTTFSFAQLRVSTGLSLFTNYYENSLNTSDVQFHNYYVLPQLNLRVSQPFFTSERFRVYSQLNLMPKQTRFELSQDVSDGSVIREGYYNLFWSGEVELGLTYDIPIKNRILAPKIGIFNAIDYFSGVGMYHKIQDFDNGYFTHTSYGWGTSFTQRNRISNYTGLSLGLSLNKFNKKGRMFGYFVNAYLPLQNMFRTPLEYELNNIPRQYQGKFYYFNAGFRFGLNKN